MCIYECDLANNRASGHYVKILIKKSFDENDQVKLLDIVPLCEDNVNADAAGPGNDPELGEGKGDSRSDKGL